MISIKKYLYLKSQPAAPDDAPAEESFHASLAQLASVTLSEIAAQCDGAGNAASGKIAESIGAFRQRLDHAESAPEIDALAAEIPVALKEFRRVKEEQEHRQTLEVQKMVEMLRQTIEALSRGNERSMARLRSIEGDIRAASQISEIVALRERLYTCVEQIRESARAEQREFSAEKAKLERDFSLIQENVALARGGLGGRAEAEKRIAETASSAVFLVLSLERYSAVKARYGAPAAERYFSGFLEEAGARFSAPKTVFRWTERSLLIELPSEGARDAIELDIRGRLAALPRTVRLDVGGRVAVLDNLHRWSLVLPGMPPAEVIQRIDNFVTV